MATTGLATALKILFIVAAVGGLGVIATAWNMRTQIERFVDGEISRTDAENALAGFGGLVFVWSATFLAAGIVFIIWMWRLAKNNEALGRPGTLGPGWAIGAWFIPVANLVIPIIHLQQLWQGSEPTLGRDDPGWRNQPRSGLLWAWWACFAGSNVAYWAANVVNNSNQQEVDRLADAVDDLRTAVTLLTVAHVLMIGAAVLGVLVVSRLTERQQAAGDTLGATAPTVGYVAPPPSVAQPSAPAAWQPDPTGRFEYRYWDGTQWTDQVSTGGAQQTDPV
jgi:hypothetical protein